MDDKRALWSAPAERSDDGALAPGQPLATGAKAVSRCACHRTPKSLAASRELSSIPRTPQYEFPRGRRSCLQFHVLAAPSPTRV